jgi:hypothetical protein
MTPERWEQIEQLYHETLQKSPGERSAFLKTACGADEDGNNQLVFGKNFLILRPGNPAAKVDHFAIGVDNFKQESVVADLKSRGVTPIDQQEAGLVSMSWIRTDTRCKSAPIIHRANRPAFSQHRVDYFVQVEATASSQVTLTPSPFSLLRKITLDMQFVSDVAFGDEFRT